MLPIIALLWNGEENIICDLDLKFVSPICFGLAQNEDKLSSGKTFSLCVCARVFKPDENFCVLYGVEN